MGRVCTIKGTIEQNLKAVQSVYETIMKLENSISSGRPIKP